MRYHDHPEGPDGPSMGADPWPSLPSGDLGLWLERDPATGDACAAAQLTAQMDGVSGRAVMGLASMIDAAHDAGVSLPDAGEHVDLTAPMNAMGLADTTFATAEIARDASGEVWTYDLALTFAQGSEHAIVVSLEHRPGEDDGAYTGLLRWQVDDQFQGGHCSSPDVTFNGSLFYARTSSSSVLLNARDGMYCGHGTAAATITDVDVDPGETYALVDPSAGFDGSSGWANSFSIVGAQFDPDTLAGDYTYAWQAGSGDSNARVFGVRIDHSDSTDLVDGDAYYGFGDRIGSTDGTIEGFFCSWAAPGSRHTMQPFVQHQRVTFDASSGRFEVPAGGSSITYAPTNDCTYEGDPEGFWYDRDLDRTDNEVAPDDIVVSRKAGAGLQLDLLAPEDAEHDIDGDGHATVSEMVRARGFVPPPL